MIKNITITKCVVISALIAVFTFSSCDDSTDAIDDAQAIAALRKVSFTHDSLILNIEIPEGALESGKSFQELLDEYPDIYSDPTNYTISLISYFLADNTSDDSQDARFDGIISDIVMDTIYSQPIQAKTDAFEVKKKTVKTIELSGIINLDTHRLPCLYIFRQTVDGDDLNTKMAVKLLYKFASEEGSIDLPEMQQNIPTRASEEMKSFLAGLLDSGIFDED